ncbi:MAG TPA: nickel-dependent hydrogenase large subunit, partial [Firmicutes bacterium]|nr:nickel-dependent hydrogenase large subunit [Bacillota bacterium]
GQDRRGPAEEALIGTEVRDPENPIEVSRIVHSFDPCSACAVQLLELASPAPDRNVIAAIPGTVPAKEPDGGSPS